ncbi:MAG: hypothetical protein J6B45_01965, partial [Clostridia bacterium]|nr:hypothetical protein [Clostridia bacterium]
MEKTYNLFKKFIPPIIILSCIGLLFALFTLLYYYVPSTASIDFKNIIPIFTAAFLAVSYAVCFVFAFSIKSLHIKRIRKNSSFLKFASLLAAGLVFFLFLFNFIQFVQLDEQWPVFKALRLIVSIPFVAYLVVGIIPKKIKRKKIVIPKWVMPITSICAVIWCILGLLAVYFWEGLGALPTTNIFRLIHTFYQAMVILFFLAEIGFEFLGKGHKLYVLTASCLFVTTFVLTGGMLLGKFLNIIPQVNISNFEIFTGVALGIYALAKLIAIQQTLKYVMKRESEGHSHHHHHHHH